MTESNRPRCRWVEEHPELTECHDKLWGMPTHDDRRHFEALAVCIMHAGLGWIQMPHKLDQFREAFSNFDPEKVAEYGETDLERLMQAPGVVHNRQKLQAIILMTLCTQVQWAKSIQNSALKTVTVIDAKRVDRAFWHVLEFERLNG